MCGGGKNPEAPPPPPPPTPAAPLKIGGENTDDAMANAARKKTGKSKLTIDVMNTPQSPSLTIPT